jgi:hypothetical protein
MNRITNCFLLTIVSLTFLTAHAKAVEDLSTMRGANYVPSYAKNDVQAWMDYDPAVVDRELGYAERLKLNTVRVFLNVAVYEKQPEKLLTDFESFLGLCDKHQIKMMPVLFDSCFDPQEVDVNNYRGKTWIPSPGFGRLGNEDWPAMEKYISAVVGKYRNDKRIVLWDVMNEPESTRKWHVAEGRTRIVAFARRALKRVKDEKPVQPIGIGWGYSSNICNTADLSDVLIMHNYKRSEDLRADIRHIKEMGLSMNKPVILNEFAGRPQQRIEEALPVIAKEQIGWCFWELMLGITQFATVPYKGFAPYQGHIYPDGTCYSVTEVAAILYPEGYTGDPGEIAAKAGFRPRSLTDGPYRFSDGWTRWNGTGPKGNRLFYTKEAGKTVTTAVSGSQVSLVHKVGPDCGIATVTVDGKPIANGEIDTYSAAVEWNRRTVVADGLANGPHEVVVTVTGRKTPASSNAYVQVVDIEAN